MVSQHPITVIVIAPPPNTELSSIGDFSRFKGITLVDLFQDEALLELYKKLVASWQQVSFPLSAADRDWVIARIVVALAEDGNHRVSAAHCMRAPKIENIEALLYPPVGVPTLVSVAAGAFGFSLPAPNLDRGSIFNLPLRLLSSQNST